MRKVSGNPRGGGYTRIEAGLTSNDVDVNCCAGSIDRRQNDAQSAPSRSADHHPATTMREIMRWRGLHSRWQSQQPVNVPRLQSISLTYPPRSVLVCDTSAGRVGRSGHRIQLRSPTELSQTT